MNKVFKFGLALTTVLLAAQANAYSPSREGKHTISGLLGFKGSGSAVLTDSPNGTTSTAGLPLSGMFGIGADYEYGLIRDEFSVGGMFRYYSTSDSVGPVDYTDTIMLIGGIANVTFYNTDRFRAYLGTGLNFIKATAKVGANTWAPAMTLGLPVSLGLGYKINDKMTIGFEHLQVMGLGEKVNGWVVSDFMFRFSFTL